MFQTRLRMVCAATVIAAGAVVPRASAQTEAPDPSITQYTLEHLMNVEVDTVFGASRYLQKVTEAPASVTIVTHEEIERYGYRTFADLLRGVRGFYVSNDRNYSYLGIRGFSRPGDYNTRVLVLIDGHRLNDSVYDLALLGTEFPLDLPMIERVEIVRGPSSSLYGTSAFFGVINVITKEPEAVRRLSGDLEVGNLGVVGGRVAASRKLSNGAGLVFSASAAASDGARTLSFPGVGTAIGMDDDQLWRLFGSATRGRWSVQGILSSRQKQIPTGAFGVSFDDPRSETTDDRGYVDLKYDGAWHGTGIVWRTAYDRYVYRGTYAAPDYFYKDSAHAEWWTTEATLTRRIQKSHLVTGGVEYRLNHRQDQEGAYYDPYEADIDVRSSSGVLGVYAQDEIALASWLSVSAGVRHDRNSVSDSSTNLRAAAIVKPRREAALKLLHGTAFRAPSAYELDYYENPEPLVPETIRTTEVVWEQYVRNKLRLSASWFHYHADDLISQIAVEELDKIPFENVPGASASGLELEVEGVWRAYQGLASYTYERARNEIDRSELTNSPRHLLRARFTGPVIPRRLFVGVETLYTGDRQTLQQTTANGALIGNVTLSSADIGPFGLSLTVGNLLDRRYGDPGAVEHVQDVIPQDGRTARVKLSWRF